ncbi:MAG: hypothetical protein AAFO07_26555 [Bacteroidota bacterium]
MGQIPKKIMECIFPIDSLSRKVKATESHSDTYFYKGRPYTGGAAENLPEEKGVFIIEVENGKLNRNIAYYANGQMEREFLFQNGQSHGKHRMFFPNGKPYIEEKYDKGKPVGTHRRWHNNGQLAREAILGLDQVVRFSCRSNKFFCPIFCTAEVKEFRRVILLN